MEAEPDPRICRGGEGPVQPSRSTARARMKLVTDRTKERCALPEATQAWTLGFEFARQPVAFFAILHARRLAFEVGP